MYQVSVLRSDLHLTNKDLQQKNIELEAKKSRLLKIETEPIDPDTQGDASSKETGTGEGDEADSNGEPTAEQPDRPPK